MRPTYTQNIFTYIALIILQMVIYNYVHLSPYIVINILPFLILKLSLNKSTISTMFLALAIGLCVDAFSDGILGLNALALIPIAFARRTMVAYILGQDTIRRNESFSVRQNGLLRISALLIISLFVFFSIYVVADSAGTRGPAFNATRIIASTFFSYIVSIPLIFIISQEEKH